MLCVYIKLLALLSILFFVSLGSCLISSKRVELKVDYSHTFEVKSVTNPEGKLCSICVQFAGQFINELLNIILNAGVIGGCTDLCGILANKTNSKLAGEVCEVLCAIEGIKEFIKLINEADLDPIYFCELLKTCDINDNGNCHITSLTVTPSVVPQGSKFQIVATYVSNNGTGTGENIFEIDAADGLPLTSGHLLMPQQPGTYTATVDGEAKPDPNCDPSQGPCEMWIPGNYTVEYAVCNGECGSKHPHSQVYDKKSTSFTVTASQN